MGIACEELLANFVNIKRVTLVGDIHLNTPSSTTHELLRKYLASRNHRM